MNDHDCQIGVMIESSFSKPKFRCLSCNKQFTSQFGVLDYLCFLYGEQAGMEKWKKLKEEYNKLKENLL